MPRSIHISKSQARRLWEENNQAEVTVYAKAGNQKKYDVFKDLQIF